MMTALNVFTAAIFSYFFLKKKFLILHYIALILIFIGIIIVTLYVAL